MTSANPHPKRISLLRILAAVGFVLVLYTAWVLLMPNHWPNQPKSGKGIVVINNKIDLAAFLERRSLESVYSIVVQDDDNSLEDEDVARLIRGCRIGTLRIIAPRITDAALVDIERQETMRLLMVKSSITGSCFRNISRVPLKGLLLGGCSKFDGEALQWISQCDTLEELEIDGTSVTDRELAVLAAARNLSDLRLRYCMSLNCEGLPALVESNKKLRWLNLSGTRVTISTVRRLAETDIVKNLVLLGAPNINKSDLDELAKAYPHIRFHL